MTGIGIWRLGFRPFYLGAAFFSASAILLWISAIFGLNGLSDSAIMPPLYWHGHEMVFGFAFAVIAGFLLTASNNWTGMLPAAGVSLAVLFLFWGSARLFMFSGHVLLAAIADGAFAVLLTALLGRVLWLARLWKNFTLLSLVILIGAFNISFYSILLLGLPVNALLPIELALLVILQLLVVMGAGLSRCSPKTGFRYHDLETGPFRKIDPATHRIGHHRLDRFAAAPRIPGLFDCRSG